MSDFNQKLDFLVKKSVGELHSYQTAIDDNLNSVVTNYDGTILKINNLYLEKTGFSNEEILGKNIDVLKSKLVGLFDARTVNTTETIVTNARHTDSLKRANQALIKVADGLDKNIAGDLLAMEIRYALDELGSITGEVTNDDLLNSIFTRFCIGK